MVIYLLFFGFSMMYLLYESWINPSQKWVCYGIKHSMGVLSNGKWICGHSLFRTRFFGRFDIFSILFSFVFALMLKPCSFFTKRIWSNIQKSQSSGKYGTYHTTHTIYTLPDWIDNPIYKSYILRSRYCNVCEVVFFPDGYHNELIFFTSRVFPFETLCL